MTSLELDGTKPNPALTKTRQYPDIPKGLESLYNTPPKDPAYLALWNADNPRRPVLDNPADRIARILFPSSTPEDVSSRWERVLADADRERKNSANF